MTEAESKRRQLEADVNALIKLVLLEMESLASQPPDIAFEPVRFNEVRTNVMRRQWAVVKQAIQYGQRLSLGDDE